MFQSPQNNLILALSVLALMLVSCDAYSETNVLEGCSIEDFKSTYYLINVADFGAVSSFYQGLSERYFDGIESFTGILGGRKRYEFYFDSEDLQLLKNGGELLISVEDNLPRYREEREKVVYRENVDNPYDINEYEVKRYTKKVTPLDKHPLFGRIKRNERPIIFEKLKMLESISPERISERLKVEHDEIVFQISHYGVPTADIVLSKFHISNFGLPNTYTLLKFVQHDAAMAKLTEGEKKDLSLAMCQANRGFQAQFPHVKHVPWFGYANYHRLASEMLPSRTFFQNKLVLFQLGQIFVLCTIGFLLITLLLGRYQRGHTIRTISRSSNSRQ